MIIPNYGIIEKIAESRQAAIYKACHKKNPHRLLALKILKDVFLTDSKKSRFRKRIEHLRVLSDSLVITPITFEAKDGICFLTQDYFDGIPLDQLIEVQGSGFKGSKVRTPERETLLMNDFFTIACGLSRAFAKVHEAGIIHGGIKPHNILVDPATLDIRLIDFISAMDVRDVSHFIYDPFFVRETLSYTSPEQTGRINHRVVFSSDLYSLGVVFYEMLTGRLPFSSDDPLELIHSHLAEEAPKVHELNPKIPAALSRIVAKLMLKEPEKRYQSGKGLLADLMRCWDEYFTAGSISDFPLESRGHAHRASFISRMVGRDKEAAIVLGEYEEVARGGFRGLFISGLPGIGKTRLIQELQKPIVKHKGYFTSGKFDFYQKSIPYSSLIQALKNLMQTFLTESDKRVALWKNRILKAVDKNGKVLADVIPELSVLIGPQPEVPPLPPVESLNRFHDVFDKFLTCLASAENPLVLFIDDLQWCDSASFDFLANIFANYKDHPYLFLLGAYRHNEVDLSHPLSRLIGNAKKGSRPLKEIRLNPLKPEHCHEMVSYILDSPLPKTGALSDFISALTEGNPLFVSESLAYLYNENLLLPGEEGQWRWDLDKIRQSSMPGTVVALYGAKIQKLPPDLISLFEYCACLGNTFGPDELSFIREMDLPETFEMLKPALEQGLLMESRNQLQFIHDRVQEAALSFISAERRGRIHRQIGNRLLDAVPEGADLEKRDNLFTIVSHLNLGSGVQGSGVQRFRGSGQPLNGERGTFEPLNGEPRTAAYFLSDLNYHAGNKALGTLATEAANEYFNLSRELLPEDCWENQRYERTFRIFQKAAKTELMCGNYEHSERLLNELLDHAKTDLDRVECLAEQTTSLSSVGNFIKAIETANRGLSYFGKAIPESLEEVDRKREALVAEIASKGIDVRETFLNMHFTTDRKCQVEHAFYSELLADLYFSGRVPELYLVAAQAILHCLSAGMDEAVIYAFTAMAIYFAEHEDFEQSFAYEDLTYDLAARYPNTFAATKCMTGAVVTLMHSRSHPGDVIDYSLKAIQCGKGCGDLNNAGYSYGPLMWNLQVQGADLPAIEDYTRECLQFSNRYHLGIARGHAEAVQAGWVEPMRKDYAPIAMEEKLAQWERDNHMVSLGSYYVLRALSHYYLGENEDAERCLVAGRNYLSGFSNSVLKREWHVFRVLNALALYEKGLEVQNEVQGSGFKGSKVGTPERGTLNLERGTLNGEHGTLNGEPRTLNLERGTLNGEPRTLNGEPRTLNLERGTLNGEHASLDEFLAEIRPMVEKIEKWAALGPTLKPYLAFLHAELERVTGVQNAVQGSGFRGSEVKTLNGEPGMLNPERFKEARSLYLDAISAAREQNFTFLEGHLNECLGELLLKAGQRVEGVYFAEAARLYRKCRAERKEVRLIEKHPDSFEEEKASYAALEAEPAAPNTLPDLNVDYLMKSSHAISAEIEQDALLKKIMNVVLESSGAQHGYLLIEELGNLAVRAESHISEKQAARTLNQKLEDAEDICKAIARYVYRTGERVILNDASREGPFKDNPQVQRLNLRSILCIPVIKQSRMIGILYLENRLSDSVFTSQKTQMTELLTSQAAISLENATLFKEHKMAEDQVKKSLKEKEVLLKEIHHRVKNNLQIIHSMLNLQMPHVKDEQAIELFKESKNRVYSMALIHEKLYESESLAMINLSEYIRSLTANLFLSYGVSERNIRAKVSVENVTLDVDTVIPCALIINELVSNSLKHAFPHSSKRAAGKGEIRIDLRQGNGDKLVLTVADNGVGLPDGFEIQNSESLGLKLVNVLAKQLRGSIHPRTNGGAEFVIAFDAFKKARRLA
jgi:predicted ATPase/two-component sensor histidine kinase/tRNA A-37 threonylcarbamoyl transferase component Bud32